MTKNGVIEKVFGRRSAPVARVAFNMRPVSGPWGGSSTFVRQFGRVLERRGYEVCYSLRRPVDVIVIVDPRDDLQHKSFGMQDIAEYRRKNPSVKVLHRVNECDQRKGSDFMDALLAQANPLADCTVFISAWLRDYHAERWFDLSRSHTVIYNGADPSIYHPVGVARYDGSGPFRIVTHHWADSRIKGYDVYERVDQLIASGELTDVELVVAGRWPADIHWTSTELHPPMWGDKLAALLRTCHAYITASTWEPCGMHHVEGAQCGLPLIYHEDGGGINEAGLKYGIGFRDDVAGAITSMREHYTTKCAEVLANMPSGDRMCLEYAEVVQRLVCGTALDAVRRP
jgi:glycosyltransferase involved in cell wall biosynthesis